MLFRPLIVIVGAACALAAPQDRATRVDAIFQPWNKPGTPGAAVAVVKEGQYVYQKGYGIANLEYGIPITPATVFHVASISKQFTAMALVLLEQQRKLSLDDDVHRYLPELPGYGHPITIRNLLQHTSGIRDQWQTLALAGWRLDDVITQQQILRMLFRQRELNFEPGTRHLYSNGGYTLAAEIVARVSGKPLPQFCQERIFGPLAMTSTHFHDDHRRIVRNRAYSYEQTSIGYEASPLNYANVGATSLFTTASDLVKWLDNFRDRKVGGPAAIARMEEEGVLANGNKIGYALGLSLGSYRGLRTISHGGSDAGYRAYVVWFPEKQTGVAMLSNLASFDAGAAANKVAAVFLGSAMKRDNARPAQARSAATPEASSLDQYVGMYRLNNGLSLQVTARDGKLTAAAPGETPFELKPLAPGRFYVEQSNGEVEFTSGVSGGMMLRITRGAGSAEGERVAAAAFDPRDMPEYAGRYWSEELETQYTVALKGGSLFAVHSHHGEIPLTPAAKDQMRGGTWFMQDVRFVRDSDNRVIAMVIGGGRVAGVRFDKR